MNSKYAGSMGTQRLIKVIKNGTTPGADSVGTSQIIDRAIKGVDISLATIELNNLSASCIASLGSGGGGLTANSVNSSHIIDGTILGTDISNDTITGANIAHGSLYSVHIANGTILGTDISNKTITAANIADQTITKFQIANGSITGTQINSSTITSSNILDGTILGTDISNKTITADNIADNTITKFQIADDAITNLKLNNDAVTTSKILDGSITDAKIAAGTITYNSLDSQLLKAISGQIGVFEIRNTGGSNIDFTIDFYIVTTVVDIFLNEYVVNNGATNFVSYLIPNNFTELTFEIKTSCGIASYVTTYGGWANVVQVGAGKIDFEIKRGQQNYLEINITPA